jgi:DNA-directed RNA polymerase subunit RPC12/RpoP
MTHTTHTEHYTAVAQRMTGVLAGLRGEATLDRLTVLELYLAEMRRQAEPRALREAREDAEQELQAARELEAELTTELEAAGQYRCPRCSSRITVVMIPADEREQHDRWHAELGPMFEGRDLA